MNAKDLVQLQRDFFFQNSTRSLSFRKEQLLKLKNILKENEQKIYHAVYEDFGKSHFDVFTTELALLYQDIAYYIKHLRELSAPKKVPTNLANQLGNSKIYPEPLGNVLVIGAWNYPFQLSLVPAIAAIAAGNTVVLKPSEVAHHSMKLMETLINENFPKEFFYCQVGGVEETTELLKEKFDKIFFTGSTRVGKIVYESAAKHLTPVTLELGGKSPVLVTESADIQVAAKRIVWGKFLNAGQTCVAPDYVMVHADVKAVFLEALKSYIEKFDYRPDSVHYTQIINEKNFLRLLDMIPPQKVFYGGKSQSMRRYIEPTVLTEISWEDEVMQEEIFGPILPVMVYTDFSKAIHQIKEKDKPLSAYLFSQNSREKEIFTREFSFGGGCINDVVMHLSNDALPFGGVGASGMGSYHGKYGFETFSHQKAVLEKITWGEPDIKYPPYSEKKLSWIKKLM